MSEYIMNVEKDSDNVNCYFKRGEIIRCKDCKFRRWEETEGFYYCALEDRPNRNWSINDTDFCSWAEREMTKQEAIKILNNYDLNFCDIDGNPIPPQDFAEAKQMAIEALEQEPTAEYSSDVISRQAAIEALYDKGLSMTAWGELLAMKWSDIQTCIEQLPSAGRPKGHWIRKQEKHQTAVCSNCEKVAIQELWGTTLRYYDFCPNCGARMESDEQ